MTETATNFPTITREEILLRAKSVLGRGQYKLGRGGFDPNAANPWSNVAEFCDCSGFAAWAIAEDRENGGIGGGWLETTAIVEDAIGPQLMFTVARSGPKPGDLVVYGDHNQRTGDHQLFKVQGHIGVISSVDASGRVYRVIHCSGYNFKKFDHAIAETDPSVFTSHGAIFVRPKKIVEAA